MILFEVKCQITKVVEPMIRLIKHPKLAKYHWLESDTGFGS